MARPTALTQETSDKILTAIRAGNYLSVAAAYAGISHPTLDHWMRRGRKEKHGIYYDFFQGLLKAQAEAEIRDVGIIGSAAERIWQASAWRLERRAPERWGANRMTGADDRQEETSELALKEARLRVEKLEAEIARLKGVPLDALPDNGVLDALEAQAAALWPEEADKDAPKE